MQLYIIKNESGEEVFRTTDYSCAIQKLDHLYDINNKSYDLVVEVFEE